MSIEASLLLEMYRTLSRTRALEDQIYYLYHNQNPEKPLLIGKGYLSTGQEGISIGSVYAVNSEDWIAPSHRDMGIYLARGVTPREIFAQYFCRATGPTHGRDGNVHLGFTSKKLLGFVSHMGASLPVANGLAAAMVYKNEPGVVLTFFGDGASSQGCVHEAMNYAAVFNLPIIFICNNNRWAISTSVHQQTKLKNLADRALAYGFEGLVVDGNDVVAIHETVKKVVKKTRKEKGPTLIECKTMRMGGHGTHDPSTIPPEEKDYWKEHDPILVMRKYLHDQKIWDEEKEMKLKKEIEQEMNEAVAWASKQPLPKPEDLLDGVYTTKQ